MKISQPDLVDGSKITTYEYPDSIIEAFVAFVTRPNRFIVEREPEVALERVLKFRRDLINARLPFVDTVAVAPEDVIEPVASVAPVSLEEMSDDELLAFADQATGEDLEAANAEAERRTAGVT